MVENQKILGAYYTPYHAAKVLADWAIRRDDYSILEPSFGGCKFLKASKDRLLALGCKKPMNKIFGYDIDIAAFETHLYGDMKIKRSSPNFLRKSFLDSSSLDFNQEFDVVIGNPPYVSYHSMTPEDRKKSKEVCKENNIDIKGKFSLWLPFVAKSLHHLKKGGRLAFILPSALIESYYAQGLLRELENNFTSVRVFSLKERLFKDFGTDEISYCLFCDGYKSVDQASSLYFYEVESVPEMKELLSESSDDFTHLNHSRLLDEIDPEAKNLLGDFFNVKIGIVTGNNKFFIISKKIVEQHRISSNVLRKIIRNKKIIKGLVVNDDHLSAAYEDGEDVELLLIDNSHSLEKETVKYLSTLDEEFVNKSKTFKKRTPWYCIRYEEIPDFFMTYMNAIGPSIIINNTVATSTNNLHRLYSNFDLTEKDKIILALSMQTSFSQLSAEILGKKYGSGVLKLEPTSAKNIQLLKYAGNKNIRGLRAVFQKVNNAIENGDFIKATSLADNLFIDSYGKVELTEVQSTLQTIRSFRYNK